jgi:hypothetical protein
MLPIPPAIWKDNSMEFIIGLPKSGNKSVIMVVVDRLSKYAHFFSLHHPFTTSTMTQIFMDQIFKLHGMSHSIFFIVTQLSQAIFGKNCLSYKAHNCISAQLIIPRWMVKWKLSTSVWKHILRCFASEKQHQWAQWLPLAEWWYNTTYHTTTRMTPFEVVYGQKPPSVLSYLLGTSKVQVVDQTLTVREDILRTLKENLVMA